MLPEDIAPEAADAPIDDQEATSTPENEQTVEAQDPDSPPVSVEPEDEKPKSRAQVRIEQLAAEKNDALISSQASREAADYWREQALKGVQPAPEPLKEDPRPTLEDHEFDQDKWAEAYTSWSDRQTETRVRDIVSSAQQEQAVLSEQNVSRANWQERASKFSEEHPDFEAVAGAPHVKITKEMFAVMQDSEKGPDLAYHLGQHPDKAAQIARMRPQAQAMELGRLEAGLTASKPQPSRAPDPPNPVGGAQPTVDPSGMSIDDWMAHRREELRTKRSR